VQSTDMKEYKEGDPLSDDEYLLKLNGRTGFLSKHTKPGAIPTSLSNWCSTDLPIYVIEETFREGWKIRSSRHGKSQSWIVLLHPCDFTVEIKVSDMVSILKTAHMDRGELFSKWKRVGDTKGGTIVPDPDTSKDIVGET